MPASLQLFNSVTWKPNSNACCRTPSSSNQQSIMGWMIPFSKRVSWRKVVLSNIVAIIIKFIIIHILIFVYFKVKSFNIEITKYIYRQIYEIKEHSMIRWIKKPSVNNSTEHRMFMFCCWRWCADWIQPAGYSKQFIQCCVSRLA